jgi:hypothetical protein
MSRTLYGRAQQLYRCLLGSTYQADANGKLSNVTDADAQNLLGASCVDRDIATQAVLGGIVVASGDGTKALFGDGTFKTPAGGASAGSSGTLQKSNGSGGFAASSIVDNGAQVSTSEPILVNGSPLSGGGAVTAVAGAATLNAQNGIVTSEALTSANSYTLTLTNNVIKVGSALLVTAYDGTNIWAPTAIAITAGAAAISLHSLSSPSNSTIQIAFAVFN